MARKDIIMMSERELKRSHIIQKVLDKELKQVEAVDILNLTDRQIRRIIKRVRKEGNTGDLPPKKWTQRRVSGRITTGSKTGGVLWKGRWVSISVLTRILSFRP